MSNYTLFYHPIAFRGNFVRCLLEYNDIQYEQRPLSDLNEIRSCDMKDSKLLSMAPPFLLDKELDLFLGQSAALVTHLARKHDMMPNSLAKIAVGEKILHDCNDVMMEITCQCGQSMWTKEKWDTFVESRFVKWLQIFENTAIREGLQPDSGFFLGESSASFVDTSVFASWGQIMHSFPILIPIIRKHAPCMVKLCDRLGENPGLKRLWNRQVDLPYCGGLIEKSMHEVIPLNPGNAE